MGRNHGGCLGEEDLDTSKEEEKKASLYGEGNRILEYVQKCEKGISLNGDF